MKIPHIYFKHPPRFICITTMTDPYSDMKDSNWQELTGCQGLKDWQVADPDGEGTADWFTCAAVKLAPDNPLLLQAHSGKDESLIVNGLTGKTENIVSVPEYGDIEIHIEFLVAKNSNSGIYFMGRYEIQVLDSWGKEQFGDRDCGAIYQRWDPDRGEGKEGYEGHAPRVNASRRPGEWQTFDVIFRAPRFNKDGEKTNCATFERIVQNGIVIHENVQLNGPTRAGISNTEKETGPIMLQGDHGPVAYRNIRVRRLI